MRTHLDCGQRCLELCTTSTIEQLHYQLGNGPCSIKFISAEAKKLEWKPGYQMVLVETGHHMFKHWVVRHGTNWWDPEEGYFELPQDWIPIGYMDASGIYIVEH